MVALVFAFGLPGCSLVRPAPPKASTLAPTTIATAPAAAAPMAARFSDLTLVPGKTTDSWTANGLVTNAAPTAAAAIQIRVSLLDGQGEELASQSVAPLLDRLGNGETSPFTADFRGVAGAASIRAAVGSSLPSAFTRVTVSIRDLRTTPDAFGGTSILGVLVNQGDRPAAVHQVAVGALQGDKLLAASAWDAGLSYLESGQSAVFLAHLASQVTPGQLAAWVDATVTTSPGIPPTALTISAAVASTPQGTPFVLGTVANADRVPRIAALVVTLNAGGNVVGLADIVLPIPLAPGETTVFAASKFPGLSSRMSAAQASIAELKAEASFDPVASASSMRGPPVPLEASVTGYEVVGSTLFIKGEIRNPRSAPVQSAAVMLAVRSTEGKPQSAGSEIVAATLAPGDHAPFTLALPLPAGVDPAMSEFDLQAGGFLSP